MSTLGKLSAALISGTNENNLALVSVNLDFSLIQLEAPKEFLSLGNSLSTKRRQTAEEGSLHRTARRLGALFDGIIPSTPALIKSYGKRVSEISASPQVNPKGSVADGIFANHIGIDGTSIWSAATSGAAAISVHLLACLIARTLSPAEATSLLVELVEERKAEIKAAIDESQIRGVADYMASQQVITRAELASWDASARSWILSADEVKRYEQVQLKLITKNVGLSVNTSGNTYRNVTEAWTTAMISLEKLINGMPQSISKGAVLLGLSAWHIFPDLNIVGQKNTTVLVRDALVAPGGIITIGLQNINEDDDSGVRWSLDLSYLKHYGDPVAVSVSSAADGTRLSADELHIIAFGSLLEAWGTIGDDPIVVARTISRIWDLIQNSVLTKKRKRDQALTTGSNDPRTQWLLPLVNAAKLVLDAVDGTSEPTVLLLLNLGRRRGREFLAKGNDIPKPLFGLCNHFTLQLFSDELQSASQERAISVLRDHAARLDFSEDECVIRYSAGSRFIDGGRVGYATALPQLEADSASSSSKKVHKRWLELDEPWGMNQGCDCMITCSTGPVQDHDSTRTRSTSGAFRSVNFMEQPKGCICVRYGRQCTIACLHVYRDCSYNCGNLNEQLHGERSYWIAPLRVPFTLGNDSWTWRDPPRGFKTRLSRISSGSSAPARTYHHEGNSEHFDTAWKNNRSESSFSKEEIYANIAEFQYVAGSPSEALFTSRRKDVHRSPSLNVEEMLAFLQSSHVKTAELADYVLSYSDGSNFARSLIGLSMIEQLHTGIGPATISMSIIHSPLHEARWLGGQSTRLKTNGEDHLPTTQAWARTHSETYSAKIGCLAMLELGAKCNIDPKNLDHVIAMSSGNSIYVARALLQDPSKTDGLAIQRIIGNVGRPGITMMIPPPQPRIRPLSDSWLLVQHAPYDGKLENCFHNTSLHLSFTTYELPLATGDHGGVDKEVMLVESLVSVHDRGEWVADLDVLGSLSDPFLQRLDKCTCSQEASKQLRTKLISLDNWEELLDSPNHREKAGVVRAHGNWIARLAATCISIQKGHRTVLISKSPVCSTCVDEVFAADRKQEEQSPQICIL